MAVNNGSNTPITEEQLKEEQMKSALLLEAIITFIENAPLLLAFLQEQGGIDPAQAEILRSRLRMAAQRLDKTWEDYLQEARETLANTTEQQGG